MYSKCGSARKKYRFFKMKRAIAIGLQEYIAQRTHHIIMQNSLDFMKIYTHTTVYFNISPILEF